MLPEHMRTLPLLRPHERRKVPIADPTKVRARQLQVLYHTVRYASGLAWLFVTGRWSSLTVAKRTRELFEQLGFLFIKMGQLLSLRSDYFSDTFCREMSRLQYAAKGFPGSLAKVVVEHELGGPLSQFFSEFDEHPFAAASIAQLHMAKLRGSGHTVAVKVMRPYAPLIFEQDLKAIRFMAFLMMRFKIVPFLRWDEGVWELNQIVREEVDYRYEVSNLKRMRKSLKQHKVYVPRVFPKLCTKSVICMELVGGALMTDFLDMKRHDPQRLNEWMKDNDIDPKKVGERLFISFMRQLFEDNQFHGDLHPGNIILLRGSRFALIDLGSVGSVEYTFLMKYALILEAIATKRYQKAADLILALTPEFPMVDLVEIKEKMVRVFRSWELKTNVKNLPYEEKSMDKVIVDAVTILSQKQIMVSWEFMKIDRTWATLDASLNLLIPQVNYPKLFKSVFDGRQKRAEKEMLNRKAFKRGLLRIPAKMAEIGLFLEPQIRRQGREFMGVAGKFSSAMAGAIGILLNGALIVATVLVTGWLNVTYGWFEDFSPIKRWSMKLTVFEEDVWVAAIAVSLYVVFTLWRMRRRLNKREIRVPGSSGGQIF